MAYFYSFISCNNKFFFPDYNIRQEMLKMNLHPDGHPSIVEYYKRKGLLANIRNIEDKVNKFEYDVKTDKLFVSYINGKDNREEAYKVVKLLDFKSIEPRLIVKPIDYIQNKQVLSEWLILNDLKTYNKLRNFIWHNIGDSIWNLIMSWANEDCNFSYDNDKNNIDYLLEIIKYIDIKAV